MTFTVAFIILVIGIFIGYRLPGPIAAFKRIYRSRTFKPGLLRPYVPTEKPDPHGGEG